MKCVLCGSKEFERIIFAKGQNIVICRICGLVATEYTKVDYTSYHRDEDYSLFEKHFRNIFLKRARLIQRYKTKGKILDIGCSTGVLLSIFKENGWETWGVEPSSSSKDAEAKGIKVIKSTFETAKISNNYFDAVVLNHTLEHVKDPLTVLRKVHKILRKGGVVLIDVPNFGSLSSQFYKDKWPYLLPHEHTFHFTPQTLKKVVEKAELTPIHVETRSGLFDFAEPIDEIYESLVTFKKRFFKNIFGFPGAFISTVLDRGTSLTVIAKKK